MRGSLRLAFLVVVIAGSSARMSRAQNFVYTGPPTIGGYVNVLPPGGFPVPSYGVPRVINGGTYLPMYDYYSAPYPLPARLYHGYGENNFPFYGQTYGHPYEPWTWAGLSRYPAYPPLRVSGFVGP